MIELAVFLPLAGGLIAGIFGTRMGDRAAQLVTVIPMLIAAGLAMSAIWPSLNAIALRGVPTDEIATAAAFLRTISRIGSAAGVAAAVALASSGADSLTGSLRSVWFLAVAALVTTLGAALIPERDALE